MENKKFVGKGRKHEFPNGGHVLNLNLCLDDIIEYAKEFGQKSNGNGKTYIRLKAGTMKNSDNWNNTHTVWVDTWKPDNQQQGGNFQTNPNAGQPQTIGQPPEQNFDDLEDVPF